MARKLVDHVSKLNVTASPEEFDDAQALVNLVVSRRGAAGANK